MNIHFFTLLPWLNINFFDIDLKIVQIWSSFEKNTNHRSDFFLNCQPEYIECIEKASESRLKDILFCMPSLILISVCKCLESGWGILA